MDFEKSDKLLNTLTLKGIEERKFNGNNLSNIQIYKNLFRGGIAK